MTDYQPGIMLLLGIRAVARRGVTICVITRQLDAQEWSRLPFSLKEINPFSVAGNSDDSLGALLVDGLNQLQNSEFLSRPTGLRINPPGVTTIANRKLAYAPSSQTTSAPSGATSAKTSIHSSCESSISVLRVWFLIGSTTPFDTHRSAWSIGPIGVQMFSSSWACAARRAPLGTFVYAMLRPGRRRTSGLNYGSYAIYSTSLSMTRTTMTRTGLA